MEFWATSESMKGVSEDFFTSLHKIGAINALIHTLSPYLAALDTNGWKKWRVIFIMMPDDMKDTFHETRRLTRKDMTLDFRVHVDYEPSLSADFATCIDLLVPPLLRTIPYFEKADIGQQVQVQIRDCVHLAAKDAKFLSRSLTAI
jgi:hypothetical protein